MLNPRRRNFSLFIQFIRISLISGLVFILVSSLVLLALSWYYRDTLKNLFTESLNEQLKTQVYVREIRLEVLRTFPLASITFLDTEIMAPDQNGPSPLTAKSLKFQFRISDLFRGYYLIRQITVSQGNIQLHTDTNGLTNYDFWEASPSKESENFKLVLQKLVFQNSTLSYADLRTEVNWEAQIKKSVLSGNFTNKDFLLNVKASMISEKLMLQETTLIRPIPIDIDFSLFVEHFRSFQFKKGALKSGNQLLDVSGVIHKLTDGTHLDLDLASRQIVIHDFLELLPDNWKKWVEGYNAKGFLEIEAKINGMLSDKSSPLIESSFHLSKGEFVDSQTGLKLSETMLKGFFTNGINQSTTTSQLSLQHFSTKLNNGRMEGNLILENLLSPELTLSIRMDNDPQDIIKLFRLTNPIWASGRLQADIAFKGRLDSSWKLNSKGLLTASSSGTLEFSNCSLKFSGNELTVNGITGILKLSGTNVIVNNLHASLGESNVLISGVFSNLLPFALLPGEQLYVDAMLNSGNLNLDELLLQKKAGDTAPSAITLPKNINLNIKAKADKIKFGQFSAGQFHGSLSMQGQRAYFENIFMHTMNGEIRALAMIDTQNHDEILFWCDSRFEGVDAKQLFYQMGDFGQQTLRSANVSGTITSDLQFSAKFSPYLQIHWESLIANADIRIEEGTLSEFGPMIALSRYLKVGDLNHVRFSTLENQIHISNRKMIIPEMDIRSSAIDLKISGEHSFDNEINYGLQVLLSDILAKRNREYRNPQDQYGDLIDDGLGRTTLFLRVDGTMDDPRFRYDYKGVREKIRDDLRKERINLRDAFRREFANPDRRSEKRSMSEQETAGQNEQQRIRKQESGIFVIEWEDFIF